MAGVLGARILVVPAGLEDVEVGPASPPRCPAGVERGAPEVDREGEPVALDRPDLVGPEVLVLRLAVDVDPDLPERERVVGAGCSGRFYGFSLAIQLCNSDSLDF